MTAVVDILVAGFTIASSIVVIDKFIRKKWKNRKLRKAGVARSSDSTALHKPGLRGGGGGRRSEPSESLISLGTTNAVATENALFLSASAMSSRTGLNLHNICRSAQLYRKNCNDFTALTKVVHTGREWSCKHCNTRLSQASLRLSPQNEDIIWITAAGMLKAHCDMTNGFAPGWTCIWMNPASECRGRFADEKGLLEHMKKHHVRLGTRGEDTHIDWPADMRHKNTKMCGFGATIGGREMSLTRNGYIVPGT